MVGGTGIMGGRAANCTDCHQAGRRLAAQLVQHAQAALVSEESSPRGERFAVALPGAGRLPYLILHLDGECRRSRTVAGASEARQHS